MRVVIEAADQATVEFESEDELRAEYERNLVSGGLSLVTQAQLPEFTPIQLTLKLSGGGKITVAAMVVRQFAGALAVSIEGSPEKIFSALNIRAVPEKH